MDGICVGLISTVILLINTLPFVVSQPGFISIDCGATRSHLDTVTNITWASDTVYSGIGESSDLPQEITADQELLTVRSFPEYKKNCYEINTTYNTKYLLRLRFLYANFDLKSSGQDQSMYLVIDDVIIQRLNPAGGTLNLEFIITAVSNVTSVCFGRVDRDPFVNSIELRELNETMYPLANGRTILSIVHQNAVWYYTDIIRYPEDPYDRFWVPYDNFWVPEGFLAETVLNQTSANPNLKNTTDRVPFAVMNNGVKTNDSIEAVGSIDGYEIALTVFFAEFDNQGDRTIESTLSYETSNGDSEDFTNYSELSSGNCNFSTVKNNYTDSLRKAPYNLSVSITGPVRPVPEDSGAAVPLGMLGVHAGSVTGSFPDEPHLPAILNAWHATSLHYRPKKTTDTTEFAIMRRIRDHFNITKWTGDPCLPVGFTWDKVECDYDGPNATVKSVDLSGMKLDNNVTDLFTNLTSLIKLDLSDNDLYGELPDALFENHLLTVDYSNNPKLRRKVHGVTTTQRNILIGIFVPVGIIALFVGFLVCRHIRGLTLEEYTKDTTETQEDESTKTLIRRVPWSSPIVKKDPSQG